MNFGVVIGQCVVVIWGQCNVDELYYYCCVIGYIVIGGGVNGGVFYGDIGDQSGSVWVGLIFWDKYGCWYCGNFCVVVVQVDCYIFNWSRNVDVKCQVGGQVGIDLYLVLYV